MARDPFANYDAWKLATPDYYDDPEPVERWDCTLDNETIEQDGTDLTYRDGVNGKGKRVKHAYAKCLTCEEYFSHESSAEDLADNVDGGDVLVDEDGKYLASRIRIVEEEPETYDGPEEPPEPDDYDYV